MDKLKPLFIEATDIQDAWFQLLWNIQEYGSSYTIEHGSYVGETRLEYDFITLHIKEPQTRPFEPVMPPHLSHVPPPCEPGYIEKYASEYMLSADDHENTQGMYGRRLTKARSAVWPFAPIDQIEHFIGVLKKTPNTNQAILQIAAPGDCALSDPACVRHIDMRIKDDYLIFYPYLRSWDLWGGFVPDLGSFVIVQEYMATMIGVKPGPIIATSKGLHLYKYVQEIAEARIGHKLNFGGSK